MNSLLSHKQDCKTVLYLLAGIFLFSLQWNLEEIFLPIYFLYIVFSISVCAVNHNHAHYPIWRHKKLNTLTDYLIIALQGHPIFLFVPAHNENHHEFCNTTKDYNYTWKYKDDNCLIGFLLHPFFAAATLIGLIPRYLFSSFHKDRSQLYNACLQYMFLIAYIGMFAYIDLTKAVILILIPQFISLFFLLASNYLQHAHTDESDCYNNSRNFVGMMNLLLFNTGYHTAHHLWPDLHWSELPSAHRRIEKLIKPELVQKSLIGYAISKYVFSILNRGFASKPLRKLSI